MNTEDTGSLSYLFDKYLRLKGISVDRLAKMIEERFDHSVSASSMRNWRDGTSPSPRNWRDVVMAAAALDLKRGQAESLLAAASHPNIDQLFKQAQGSKDAFLFINWLMPLPSEKLEKDIAYTKDNTDQLLAGQQQVENKADHMLAGQQEILAHLGEWGHTQSSNMQPYDPPYILPRPDIRYFKGRIDELNRLEQILLAPDDTRMTCIGAQISGTGGMGKSSLAYHFVYTHLEAFKEGGVIALTINDGRADNFMHYDTPVKIARHLLQLINHPLRSDQHADAIETMLMVFRRKKILLILDNVENEETIRGLIPGGSCRTIVTTRNRSLLDHILPGYAQIHLHPFSYTETRQLLGEFIGEKRITDESDETTEIHDLAGGLPLALRIVGSALKYQNAKISSYVSMLRAEKLALLHDPSKRTSNDPDYSVRASFNVSLNFLEEQQKVLFACLSACAPEGFGSAIAQVVADQSESAVRSGLELLYRLSLIDHGTDVERFLLHPLLYVFAHDLAREKNLLKAAEQRHTDYFLDYIQELRKPTSSARQMLEENLDGFLLAARYLPANLSLITTLYLAIKPLLQRRGYWEKALELLDRRLEIASKQKDFYEIAQTLIQRGQFLGKLDRLKDAEKELKEAQSQASRITDEYSRQSVLGMALNSLGGVYLRMKKLNAAITAFQQSYNIRKALGDKKSLAFTLNSLGGAYQDQRRYQEALNAFQESLTTGREEGMHDHVAKVLNSLGGVYLDLKRPDEAVTALEESYNRLVGLGDEMGQAMALNSLGEAYQQLGEHDKAVEALQKSVSIERKARNNRGLAMALTTLGNIYRRQRRYDKALISLQEALSLEEKREDYNSQVMVMNSLGRTLLEQNEHKQALNYLQASFAIVEARPLRQDLPQLVELLIDALTPLQQLATARDYCTRALKLAPGNSRLQQLQKQLQLKEVE